MRTQGVDPLDVTGDHVRFYSAALLADGKSSANVGRASSVFRGKYLQFAKHGLMPWDQVRDIQTVGSPRVDKRSMPALSEVEARKLLHESDTSTLMGLPDHALLFAFFKTACRCAAIANACVGHIERANTNWYFVVREKGRSGHKRRQRKALLEATGPVFRYIEVAGIGGDVEGPLFRPVSNDRRTFARRLLTGRTILHAVKKIHPPS